MLRVVEYAYDDLGRPLTTKDATGTISSTQTYTDNGNIASIKDARNNTTNFSYDEYDRPKRTTDADTKWTEISTYDANGNPLTVTTRDSQTITFGFDNLNRVTSRTASPTASYSYDLAGRLLTASKDNVPGDAGTGVFTNFYDTAGRFYKEQYPDGKSVTHVLDPNGNVTKTTYPDGFFVENSYDQLNRMTGTKLNGSGTNAISYGYDALSRLTSQTYENGASKTIGYALDNAVTDIDHNFVGSTVSFDYGYNANNEPSTMQVSDAAYMWNPLVSKTILYGAANSINTYPTVGGAAQQYTNLGALKDDGKTAFSYNNINQLTNVSRGALSVSYSYDANDRQVQKTVSGGAATQFYYSGSMRLADASGGTVQDRFVYGVDGQIAMKVSAGANTYYHTDREGSVIGLSNSSGAVTNKFAYSSFGESVDLSGTTHGYLGQRVDSETGLTVGAGGSTFDPSLGRVVTATTGGSFGFGNTGGSNAQQGPGPSPAVTTPGQWSGINGLSTAGPDPRNPFFAFVPPPPQSSPTVVYLPTIQDPTKRDKGGVGSDRKDLLKLILDTFRELTIGDAERLLEYLSKPHSHEENFQKAIEMIVDKYGFKALGKLGTIIRNIHGNSHGASNTQWVYQIFDTVSQTVHKYGITGVPAKGPNQFPPRVQNQLNKLNKGNPGQYDAGIVDEINHGLPGARNDARNIEIDLNTDFLNTHGQLPPGNKRI
jgi:YD repeat-containing protein